MLKLTRPFSVLTNHVVKNFYKGDWHESSELIPINDLYSKNKLMHVSNSNNVFLGDCPNYGLHNPLKNVHRYQELGNVCFRIGALLDNKCVSDHLIKLIQLVCPKSYDQASGEVNVTKNFFKNFSQDNPQYLAHGYFQPGDRTGQHSINYRFPYGRVAIISPFNFPLEIPALQMMGALLMGNRPLVHVDYKVSVVMEHFINLMLDCGLCKDDFVFINGYGRNIEKHVLDYRPNMTLFTGSTIISDHLSKLLNGKIKVEDGGFNWKIIDKNIDEKYFDMIATTCDKDAYSFSGQKCSAQRLLFIHKNNYQPLVDIITEKALKRNVADKSIVPLLSVSKQQFIERFIKLSQLSTLLFGREIDNSTCMWSPTCFSMSCYSFIENYDIVCQELFGPLQVIVQYDDDDIDNIIDTINKIDNKLTCAIVSDNIQFQHKFLENTVNGTTYVGLRARTTGAPQNRWFGPGCDPRGGSLGTPEAIRQVWSYSRSITTDNII